MNNIRFDRRKKNHEKDVLAYYHKDYPQTMFFTIDKKNKNIPIRTIIKIVRHESLHDVLTRRISHDASIAIDNKWPNKKREILVKKLKMGLY